MLSEQIRKLAAWLRKQSEEQVTPAPTPNPIASRARGDMGSMDFVGSTAKKPSIKGIKGLQPQLPKL